MREFQSRYTTRRFIYSRAVQMALLIFAVVLLRATWGAFEKMSYAKKRTNEAASELSALVSRKSGLSARVEHLETPYGREEEMRGKFMVGKPGEGVILLVDPKPATSTEENSNERFWSKFLNFFKRD